ncbi:MAG: glycosyltransferase family 8 protein [Oscillospiraceae bacterium]|nr:glycosyltransferase family 8 protein [Oscillospiraceae bacterium]
MLSKEIPIFFSIDDAYAPFLDVALGSAIKNSSEKRNYRAIVLHKGLSKENIKRLSKNQRDNFKIDFVPMKNGLESITDRVSNRLRHDTFTLTIYFRLFIADMFPEYDKAIYIDSDVVILGDISELFDTDIGDDFIGACVDISANDVPVLSEYMEKAVGVEPSRYINSGVLLMNLSKLRDMHFSSHFLSLLDTYHFDSVAPDQDYINAICNGKIYQLDKAWNTMPNERCGVSENPKLIHYNLFSKPWCRADVQYEDVFWKYADESGYKEEIKRIKEHNMREKKNAGSEGISILINRAKNIISDEITMAKLSLKGVKIRL